VSKISIQALEEIKTKFDLSPNTRLRVIRRKLEKQRNSNPVFKSSEGISVTEVPLPVFEGFAKTSYLPSKQLLSESNESNYIDRGGCRSAK